MSERGFFLKRRRSAKSRTENVQGGKKDKIRNDSTVRLVAEVIIVVHCS